MKELEFLKIINKTLSDNSFLGDDCAYISQEHFCPKGFYVTHDTLVEDIHFSLSSTSAYELGQKAVNVNFSDLAAMCSIPSFITVSLSLPSTIGNNFVENLYQGINDACEKYNAKVIGGDLTGSKKVMISICAFGKKTTEINISRKFAKVGDYIITTGFHGDSAGGLILLNKNIKNLKLTNSHICPTAKVKKAQEIAKLAESIGIKSLAMMDTSDGLADALCRISKESNVCFECNFSDVPVSNELKQLFPNEYKNLVFWGGEDFELLICVPQKLYEKLDKTDFFKIGVIKEQNPNILGQIIFDNSTEIIDNETYQKKSFNHFEDKKQ